MKPYEVKNTERASTVITSIIARVQTQCLKIFKIRSFGTRMLTSNLDMGWT